VRRQRSAYM